MTLFDIAPADRAAVLALNNAHAEELSWLEPERLAQLLDSAFFAKRIGSVDAFMIAFDQEAPYDGMHFLWHKARSERFVYVDRIVVAPAARGRGLARRLYEGVFAAARDAGHDLITCEVNLLPPNPASDAFHAALGFVEVGRGRSGTPGKSVRYFSRAL